MTLIQLESTPLRYDGAAPCRILPLSPPLYLIAAAEEEGTGIAAPGAARTQHAAPLRLPVSLGRPVQHGSVICIGTLRTFSPIQAGRRWANNAPDSGEDSCAMCLLPWRVVARY